MIHKTIDFRLFLNRCLIHQSFYHRSFARAKGYSKRKEKMLYLHFFFFFKKIVILEKYLDLCSTYICNVFKIIKKSKKDDSRLKNELKSNRIELWNSIFEKIEIENSLDMCMIFFKNKGLYKKNFYFVLLFIFMSGIEYFFNFSRFFELSCN